MPFSTYNVIASRDNNSYSGIIVGTDPFHSPGTSRVPTFIVPLIVITNSVGTSFNPTSGAITSAPGVTKFDPTAADNSCLSAPNNVPLKLFTQSPIVNNAQFQFGNVDAGNTQYNDAFQRANFWNASGNVPDGYHVLLGPVKVLSPVTINVPANEGTTRPAASTPNKLCGPEAIVNSANDIPS